MRFSSFGSLECTRLPGKSVEAIVRIILSDSNGGVGAKIASCPAVRISRATSRLLIMGLSSSPLLASTHHTNMGDRPITDLASTVLLISHTPSDMK